MKRDFIKIAAVIAVLVFTVVLLGRIETAQGKAETESVREAVKNAALTCYAVEGAYPDTLEYLKENYQLSYNEDLYYITYDAFASNRIPDIYVTERGTKLP